MLFEFLGILTVCAAGMVFMFFGALGNSMPTLIVGAIIFIIGGIFLAYKVIADVISVPVKTYSMTLSVDNTTLLTIPLTIIICVATVYTVKWMLR